MIEREGMPDARDFFKLASRCFDADRYAKARYSGRIFFSSSCK